MPPRSPALFAAALGCAAIVCAALGCAAPPTSPDLALRDALRLVSAGDPAAWTACGALPVGDGQGECRLAAAPLQADREAACASVVEDIWRDECWFELAEGHAQAARWDGAVTACAAADAFRGHCARHLWAIALQSGTADPTLRARLDAAFPAHADEIAAVDADYRALSADLAARGTRADGQGPRSETELAWERSFRDAARIDTRACADDPTCLAVARAVYTDRWRRISERNAGLLDAHCAGRALPARLDPGDDPTLAALAETLRAETCAVAAKP